MRRTHPIRTALFAVVGLALLPAALPAEETPSVKEGFKEVGRGIEHDTKAGWDATKDAGKKGWDKTKDGVGTALEKTGEGLKQAGDDVKP
jgi:hypothetical protein